jgi:FG-GAP repeat
VWSQQAKLVGTGAVGPLSAEQGYSVSLSGDGKTAFVGGPLDDGAAGAAWVYTLSGGVWSQQAKLIGTGAVNVAEQGISVSLSGDGDTAIVGGPSDNSSAGAVWVYTRSGDMWGQRERLVGTGAVGAAIQGSSVSLSGDGNTAIVGGPTDNDRAGAAWVFAQPVFAGTPGEGKLLRQERLGARPAVSRAQCRGSGTGVFQRQCAAKCYLGVLRRLPPGQPRSGLRLGQRRCDRCELIYRLSQRML